MSSAWLDAWTGNQSISSPRAMPSADATTAMAMSGPSGAVRSATRSVSDAGRDGSVLSSDPIGAGSYALQETDATKCSSRCQWADANAPAGRAPKAAAAEFTETRPR
jgi:hypothetical protein